MKGRCSIRIKQKQLSALQHAGDSLLIFIQGQRRSKGHTERNQRAVRGAIRSHVWIETGRESGTQE